MLKKIWNDPVWSKVIAVVILAGASALITYLKWWPTILSQWIARAGTFLLSASPVPHWLLVLLIVLAAPAVLAAVLFLWAALFSRRQELPRQGWLAYTTDYFFGLRWRWRYSGFDVENLVCFCPHCDFQVYPQNASGYIAVDRIRFVCDSCRGELVTVDESFASLEDKVRRFIQQKLRNGTWSVESDPVPRS